MGRSSAIRTGYSIFPKASPIRPFPDPDRRWTTAMSYRASRTVWRHSPVRNGLTILVRNHELLPDDAPGPFGDDSSRLKSDDAPFLYDRGRGRTPVRFSSASGYSWYEASLR